MVYAGVLPGDIAILKASNIAHHGQIVAAGVEEETWKANLKFFIQTNGTTVLRSANPDYEDMEFTVNHRIIGTFVALLREDSPSLNTYMQVLVTKDELQGAWIDVVETAMSKGGSKMKGDVKALIDCPACKEIKCRVIGTSSYVEKRQCFNLFLITLSPPNLLIYSAKGKIFLLKT